MMADTTDKRPFWAITRIQGLIIMAAGIAMLFSPITAPHAGTVIALGAGWAGGGMNAKLTRGKMFAK
jgi:hypothetical protein